MSNPGRYASMRPRLSRSRLERWRDDIEELRGKNFSCALIAAQLKEDMGIVTSREAVRQILRRGVAHKAASAAETRPGPAASVSSPVTATATAAEAPGPTTPLETARRKSAEELKQAIAARTRNGSGEDKGGAGWTFNADRLDLPQVRAAAERK